MKPTIDRILPEHTVIIFMGHDRVIGTNANFFFAVFTGKVPNWHKIVVPAMRRAMWRLTGKSWSAWGIPGGMGSEDISEKYSPGQADLHYQADLKREPSHPDRRRWIVWDGQEFVDLI